MRVGASTANLYPALTEEALSLLLKMGIKETEIFLNTKSETTPSFLANLKSQIDDAGATVKAIHPYISSVEPYLLFSSYERRFLDGMEEYKYLFEAASTLNAPYVVMHGAKESGLPADEAIGRFERLYDFGKTFGVTLLQENVVMYRSADLDYIRLMRQMLRDKAGFVLDFKQSRRCGLTPSMVLDAMGDSVRHVHISDGDGDRLCLPPGKGSEDLKSTLKQLHRQGYNGSVILELYRSNFNKPQELAESVDYLENLLSDLG